MFKTSHIWFAATVAAVGGAGSVSTQFGKDTNSFSWASRFIVAPAYAQEQNGSDHNSGTGRIAEPRRTGAGGAEAGAGTGGSGTGASPATGPARVNQNRYRGGAETPPADTTTTTESDDVMRFLNSPRNGESFSFPTRCSRHHAETLSPTQRVSGPNLQLLSAAQTFLAPGFEPGNQRSGIQLLADYQEELEREKPDATLAGAYLGLVATRPVTTALVGKVNAILCVTSSTTLANQISIRAEEQRRVSRK